jgi:hypothetical protein
MPGNPQPPAYPAPRRLTPDEIAALRADKRALHQKCREIREREAAKLAADK